MYSLAHIELPVKTLLKKCTLVKILCKFKNEAESNESASFKSIYSYGII